MNDTGRESTRHQSCPDEATAGVGDHIAVMRTLAKSPAAPSPSSAPMGP
jgi:hypothetical protein